MLVSGALRPFGDAWGFGMAGGVFGALAGFEVLAEDFAESDHFRKCC